MAHENSMKTLDEFLRSTDSPKGKVRSLYDWYGSIVLNDSDSFDFCLILFYSLNPQRKDGTMRRFGWHPEQKQLTSFALNQCYQPVMTGDHIEIELLGPEVGTFQQDAFSKLSDQLVEAFLDEHYRARILSTLVHQV